MSGINFSQFGKYEKLARQLVDTQTTITTWNVKDGASLNKMRKVAGKLLENPDLTTNEKASICKKLGQAIQDKKVYYESTKKGKIVDALRSTPLFSKLFNKPIAKATELNDKIASESLVKIALAEEEKKHFYSDVNNAVTNSLTDQSALAVLASAFKEEFVPSANSKEFAPFMEDLLRSCNLENTLKVGMVRLKVAYLILH